MRQRWSSRAAGSLTVNLVSLAQPQWPWSRKGSHKLEVQCQCLSGLFFLLSLPLTHLGPTSPQSCKYNTFLTLLPELLKWSCLVIHWGQLNKKRRGKLSVFVCLKYHWQECVLIWTLSLDPYAKSNSQMHRLYCTSMPMLRSSPCQNVLSFPVCRPNLTHCLSSMTLGTTPNYFRFGNLSILWMPYALLFASTQDMWLSLSLIFPVFGTHTAGECLLPYISNSTKTTALHTVGS